MPSIPEPSPSERLHIDILLRFYEDDRDFAKHHENQRTSASNLILLLSAGLFALTGYDGQLDPTDSVIFFLIFVIGGFGAVFTAKIYERTRLHLYRCYAYRARLAEALPQLDIEALKRSADARNARRFGVINRISLNSLWVYLHLLISISGLTMSVVTALDG